MTLADCKLVVIGASAGAVDALSALLPHLPASYRLPILIVVHLPAGRNSQLTSLFRAKCAMRVVEVEDQEPLVAGNIYFAPPDYHLLVESRTRLALSNDEPVQYSRPSIDVLFETAADVFGPQVAGIVLTGANADGAAGLRAIVAAGGSATVVRPGEPYSAAMPQAAIAANPGCRVLELDEILALLIELGGQA
jgi:two-component system chemotaxis response regulator CheB